MPRRKTPTQDRSRATVGAIVEATGQVLGARGPRGTTTVHVASRAGVSVGSLYQYFPDKEALIAAFFEARLRQDVELLERVVARAAGSPVDVLRVAIEETVALYRRDRELYRSVAEMLPLMEQTVEVREGLGRAHAFATAHLRAHPELLGGRDPELVATIALHTVRGALFRVVETAPEKLDDPALPGMLLGSVLGLVGLGVERS